MRFFARSIRSRLVVLIVVTVLAVVAVHDVAAFIELRRAALTLATERLDGVAERLGDMLQAQGRLVRQQINLRARDRAIVALLRDSSNTSARDSVAVLLRRAVSNLVSLTELRGPDGRVILSAGNAVDHDPTDVQALMRLVSAGEPAAVGPMHRVRDSIFYGVIARVTDGNDVRGYIVDWRPVASSSQGRRQVLELIGPDASMYVGNAQGAVWTDFVGVAEPPPAPLAEQGLTSYTRAGVGEQLAAARPIGGTPWTIIVELPEARVYAPVRAMLQRLAIITAVLLAIGLAVAWLFGTHLTTPLKELAGAATAIRGGDYSQRVKPTTGHDEVGTLGAAFNQMAESIESAHRALEERSDELAHRAEQLADQATELETSNEELAQSVEETLRARDELAFVTAELEASLASAPVGFALHDSTARYRRVNATLASLNGVGMDAHLGRLPSEIVPDIGAQLEQHVHAVLAGQGRIVNVALSGTTPSSGRTQHWLASVYPISTSTGDRIGVGSVVTDLTAYKHLERQLIQAQKMEAVGRLAGGIAHDFNNILTAIEGFSQFALTDLAEPQRYAVSVREDLEQVLAAAGRAGALTKQLLAFSRQQVLQPRVLDLNTVVAGLSPMLARLIGPDVRLRTTTPPALGAVKADPNQMEQVIVNLVVNARDAMPTGGTVVIETSDVELDAAYTAAHEWVTPGEYVMLAVTDTGVGMDAVTRAQIFDPFFTTKGPREGTGLGLATVYGIVKQSGGSVEVYSEPGRGTSFKIYLPRCYERAERLSPTRPTPAVPNGLTTVLLVDDDPQVAATARRALQRAGYVVLSATNGREALDAAQSHQGEIALLVTDLVMPEIGGRELAQQITARRPGIRVLYTSGYTAEAINQQSVLDLGDAFLGKPFSPDGLLRRVYEILHPMAPPTV